MAKTFYIEIDDHNSGDSTIPMHDVSKKTHTMKQIKDLANYLFMEYMESTYFDPAILGKPDKIEKINGYDEELWLVDGGDPNNPEDYYPADELLDSPLYIVSAKLKYDSNKWRDIEVCDLKGW